MTVIEGNPNKKHEIPEGITGQALLDFILDNEFTLTIPPDTDGVEHSVEQLTSIEARLGSMLAKVTINVHGCPDTEGQLEATFRLKDTL